MWEQLGQGIRNRFATIRSISSPLPIGLVDKSFNVLSPILGPRADLFRLTPREQLRQS
jgi:hypothetical protein